MTATVPRYTEFWRETTRIAGEALVKALEQPEVGVCWDEAIEAVGRAVDNGSAGGELETALAALASAVREHGPEISDLYGPYLRQFLDTLVAQELFTQRGDTARAQQVVDLFMPQKIWRLRPDNPIELASDGRTATEIETAKRTHVLQLHSYFQSLQPAGRIGRPKGSRAKGPTRTRLDVKRARRALELDEAGKEWPEIARDVLGANSYAGERERERLRKRVARLIERGLLDRGQNRPGGKN